MPFCNSVSIVTVLYVGRTEEPISEVGFPLREQRLFLSIRPHSFGAHSASNLMGTGTLFWRLKWSGREAIHSPSSTAAGNKRLELCLLKKTRTSNEPYCLSRTFNCVVFCAVLSPSMKATWSICRPNDCAKELLLFCFGTTCKIRYFAYSSSNCRPACCYSGNLATRAGIPTTSSTL